MKTNEVIGNIYDGQSIKEKYAGMLERGLVSFLQVSRREAELGRLRKKTDAGEDITIDLPRGSVLREGDVIWLDQDKMVVVQVETEEIMVVYIRPEGSIEEQIETAVRVGHALGNQHHPISIDRRIVNIPVETSREVLAAFLSHIAKIDVRFEEGRFERPEAYHHEHS
jgi:urease accessory protein